VIYGLCGAGASQVTVLNRTPQRAETLVADLAAGAGTTRLSAEALTVETLADLTAEADLLVNTTTVGMWPNVEATIWPAGLSYPAHLALCDLVYRPLETQLIRQARTAGALTVDGLGMLIAQGALSFEMWTGQWPPVDAMRAACERILFQEQGE
jgi:shikimate dehydrogenase